MFMFTPDLIKNDETHFEMIHLSEPIDLSFQQVLINANTIY